MAQSCYRPFTNSTSVVLSLGCIFPILFFYSSKKFQAVLLRLLEKKFLWNTSIVKRSFSTAL